MWAALSGISATLSLLALCFSLNMLSVTTVALAVVCGQTVSGVLLWSFGFRSFGSKRRGWTDRYVRLCAGTVLSGIAMWICRGFFRQILHFSETFQNFLIIAIVFTVGFVVYSIWLILFGIIRFSGVRVIVGDGSL